MSDATMHLLEMDSELAGRAVELAVLTPPGFELGSDPLPLLVFLHGGGGDRAVLQYDQARFEAAWRDGSADPMVVVAPTTGPLSWYADPWGDVVAEEIPAFMAERFGTRVDRAGCALAGRSMGGYGTLNIAFKRPDRFGAIAALEPAVEPGLGRGDATARNTFYRFVDLDGELWGSPINDGQWKADNPANLAVENADAIRASGMEICLEVGDEDALNLHDGAEFLHRVLWDLDIRHEYHLVRWADHVGLSFDRRMPEVIRFISDAFAGGRSAPAELALTVEERAWLEWIRNSMDGEPKTVDLSTERGPALLRMTFEEKMKPVGVFDPTAARAYGPMPRTRPHLGD
jgi:S-formylglutathione hydrolase